MNTTTFRWRALGRQGAPLPSVALALPFSFALAGCLAPNPAATRGFDDNTDSAGVSATEGNGDGAGVGGGTGETDMSEDLDTAGDGDTVAFEDAGIDTWTQGTTGEGLGDEGSGTGAQDGDAGDGPSEETGGATGDDGGSAEDTGPASPESWCGDGVIDGALGESCDDGARNGDGAPCTTSCQIAQCGDGLVRSEGDDPEGCDDGGENGTAGRCNATCTFVCDGPCPVFVDPRAREDGDGHTWQSARSDLQRALDEGAPGSTYFVHGDASVETPAPGAAYVLFIPEGAQVYGGFAGTEVSVEERVPDPELYTRLDGAHEEGAAQHVVWVEGGARLDGFEIHGGDATSALDASERVGGGLRVFARDDVWLEHLVVHGNRADLGGGMHIAGGAQVTLSDVALHGNEGHSGGAIYSGAVLTVRDSAIRDNGAANFGGALRLAADASFSTVEIAANTAAYGGAIYAGLGVELTLQDAELRENEAAANGGALFAGKRARVSVFGSNFVNNHASSGGGLVVLQDETDEGAPFQREGLTRIANSRFEGNAAIGMGRDGGALRVGTDLVVTDSDFVGNIANHGGAVLSSNLAAGNANQITFYFRNVAMAENVSAATSLPVLIKLAGDTSGGRLAPDLVIIGGTLLGNSCLSPDGAGLIGGAGWDPGPGTLVTGSVVHNPMGLNAVGAELPVEFSCGDASIGNDGTNVIDPFGDGSAPAELDVDGRYTLRPAAANGCIDIGRGTWPADPPGTGPFDWAAMTTQPNGTSTDLDRGAMDAGRHYAP